MMLIAVTGQCAQSESVQSMVSLVESIGCEAYVVADHGERLARNPNAVREDMAQIDGLIVMGSDEDICPSEYGEIWQEGTLLGKHKERGAYENVAIQIALDTKIPLIGICCGMQRLNVGYCGEGGGTLYQSLEDIFGHNDQESREDRHVASHDLDIVSGTTLAKIAGNQTHKVNSIHHQAISTLRNGFVVSAYDVATGTIEAIEPSPTGEYAGQFAVGVQWHPEFIDTPLTHSLMKHFYQAMLVRHSSGDTMSAGAMAHLGIDQHIT